MKSPNTADGDSEVFLLAQLAACVSVFSFLVYLRHHEILLYGDAIAHINIARRVFDSRTPGLLQLGTVWLPLPHLLMVPFLISNWLWQTGIGGSIPSMIAYIFGVAGIFRLVRGALSIGVAADRSARLTASGAAIVYGANPNLIYMQATAMTESLYLAFFVWALVYFTEFVRAVQASEGSRKTSSQLLKCGWCVAGACLTRYDGWFLGGVLFVAALAVLLPAKKSSNSFSQLKITFVKFTLIMAAMPVLWLAYNAVVYRNALEFANGPYSAKAIEQKTAVPGAPAHPGTNDLPVAASYLLKAAELNVLPNNWHRIWLLLLVAGTVAILISQRQLWVLLLLWTPLPFYVLSIAYSGVPIFLPPWWPFSIYNARYGLQLLPAFAVFIPLCGYFAARVFPDLKIKLAIAFSVLLLAGTSYEMVWKRQPVLFQEAWINSGSKNTVEEKLAAQLDRLPRGSNYLMYLGSHVGAMERAGIPLKDVINEGNHRPWEKPRDPDGLWERALAHPEQYVQYVIAFQGDDVDEQVNKKALSSLLILHVEGQPPVTIYRVSGQSQGQM
jgi:hypothetical protein